MPAAYELARKIAAGPPSRSGSAKRALYHSEETDLRGALEFETFAQNVCSETEDAREGNPRVRREKGAVVQGPLTGEAADGTAAPVTTAQGMAAMRIDLDERARHQKAGVADAGTRGGGGKRTLVHASSNPANFVRSMWKTCALTDLVERGAGGLETAWPDSSLQHVARLALDVPSRVRKRRVDARLGAHPGPCSRWRSVRPRKTRSPTPRRRRGSARDGRGMSGTEIGWHARRRHCAAIKIDLHQRVLLQEARSFPIRRARRRRSGRTRARLRRRRRSCPRSVWNTWACTTAIQRGAWPAL
jgi:hypothetical protein